MTWDKPRRPTGTRPSALDSNVYATAAARAGSDTVETRDVTAEPKWSGAVRVLGLLLPSSWVWLTVCVWWTWRLLALYARGDFETVPTDSPLLLAGMAQDLFAAHTVFATVRLVCALASPDRDPRTTATLWTTRLAMVVFAISALFRIVDLVHCALEKSAPGVAFWRKLLETPLAVLLQGGAFAAIIAALATGAIGRYAMSSDLETAWRLASWMPRGRSRALTALSCVLGIAATAATLTGAWRHGERDWRRNPELHAISALIDAAEQRDRAMTPHLEP